MWQLEYVINGKVKELIANNLACYTAKWMRKNLKNSGNYSLGLIKLSKMK